MTYEAKPLPFEQEQEGISKKTLEIHHDKLYAGYVNKKNELEEKLTSTEIDRSKANGTYSEYGEMKREETFAANGVYLHEYYFDILGGDGNSEQATTLKSAIEKNFGSIEKWREDFVASGMTGRGWAILAYDTKDGKLHNYVCDMHNQGGVWGALPIIVLDVYEHAYFIDYGSDRKSYIEAFLKNLNWAKAEEIFTKIK